jgi:hypothetical protein
MMATADLEQINKVYSNGFHAVEDFTIDARWVRAEGTASDDEDATAQSGEGVARVDPDTEVKMGGKLTFAVKADGMQFFDPDTEKAIWT